MISSWLKQMSHFADFIFMGGVGEVYTPCIYFLIISFYNAAFSILSVKIETM